MGDPLDPVAGGNPYAELAERIIFHGLTAAELTEFATLKSGKTIADLNIAIRQRMPGLSYEQLVGRIAEALRETVVPKIAG